MVPLRVLSRTNLAERTSLTSSISFTSFRLRTLKLSCRSFSDSRPLFSMLCGLFLQNPRGGIPFRELVRCTEAQKCPFVSPLLATLTHSASRKSFPCHSYANIRDRGATATPVSASVSLCLCGLCGESVAFFRGQPSLGGTFWSAAAGRRFCGRNVEDQLSYVLFLRRVIPFARQHLQIVVVHVHFYLAPFPVVRRIRRVVAQGVLAAQLLGNLVERFGHMFLGVDEDGAASRFFHSLVRHSAIPAAEARVRAQQDVHHRVTPRHRFDPFFQT